MYGYAMPRINGFAPIDRSIDDLELSPEAEAAFGRLVRAAHIRPMKVQLGHRRIELQPGQLAGSMDWIIEQLLRLGTRVAKRVIREMEQCRMIARRAVAKFGTVITILPPSQWRKTADQPENSLPSKNQQLGLQFRDPATEAHREDDQKTKTSPYGEGAAAPPIAAVGRSDGSSIEEGSGGALSGRTAPDLEPGRPTMPPKAAEAPVGRPGGDDDPDDDDPEDDDGGHPIGVPPAPPEAPRPAAALPSRPQVRQQRRAGIIPHPMPPGWEPDGVTMHHAMARCGLTMDQIEDELEAFRVRRAGKALADWQGEFRRWLRRSFKITEFRGDIPLLAPSMPLASRTMSTWDDVAEYSCEFAREKDDDD